MSARNRVDNRTPRKPSLRTLLKAEIAHLETLPVNPMSQDLMKTANPERYEVIRDYLLKRLEETK